MSQTQFNQLGSCEFRRLTQLSSTDFIWSGWGVFHAWPAVKNAWRPTLGQTPISHEPNHTHNQWWLNLVHVNVWISLKCMNQPRSQFFFQHGCLYFESARAYFTYAWFIAVNVLYLHIPDIPSVFHNERPCNGYRELYSGRNIDFILKNYCPARPLFYFFGLAVRFESN